jgi:uncharacterized protein
MAATSERKRFRNATALETVRKLREYHPRQWVDCSSAAYKRRRLDSFLEYHPRQWVDCSGAAYKRAARRLVLHISPLAARGEREGKTRTSVAPLCRQVLNNPLTAVSGISGTFTTSPSWWHLLRIAAVFAGALVAVALTSGCSSRGREVAASSNAKPAQGAKVENFARRPISDIPQIKRVVDSAIEQTSQTTEYDPSYAKLEYPNGDVPLERGVCADVIVRAFRNAGIDLQKEVHEDMARHFGAYPDKWGARKPDRNIDHRRVPNLMTLFERKSKSVPITRKASDYLPGDVVAWELDNHLLHIGLVADAVSGETQNYLIVHNIGAGARIEDVLMSWKIIGHYRMWK